MSEALRPNITEYSDPAKFLADMLNYRRHTERGFSIQRHTRGLRRVSPTLISLIVSKKRSITVDRADELGRLLNLNSFERTHFRGWIQTLSGGTPGRKDVKADEDSIPSSKRKNVSTSLLSDWINVYVKDLFQLESVRKNPTLIDRFLLPFASAKRIRRATSFLFREGHLRKNQTGETVLDSPLSIADPRVPSAKIRQFHKAALRIAQASLDLYPAHERLANTLVLPLSEADYREMLVLVDEFAERIKDFASTRPDKADRLYQFVLNISPVGGKQNEI